MDTRALKKADLPSADDHRPQENCLLAALPESTMARVGPCLRFEPLAVETVLYEPDSQIQHVYFPTDSIVSLLYLTANGASTEVAMVGKEGVLGESVFMGAETTPHHAVVQGAGGAYSLPRSIIVEEFHRHGELMALMLRYTQSLITQMAQNVACNRHHCLPQQLCRWLLISMDRLPGNELRMTHELIANNLGVRREGVTEAAGELQRRGAITYKRGKIEVLDRDALESTVCECYGVVKKETDRLLGAFAPGP